MVTRFCPRLLFSRGGLLESLVRSIASPVDGAPVPSTEVQAPQPWVVIRPSFIQSRTGMRMSISLGDFRVATISICDGISPMTHHSLHLWRNGRPRLARVGRPRIRAR
jgi:hypothetical protein